MAGKSLRGHCGQTAMAIGLAFQGSANHRGHLATVSEHLYRP